MGPIENREKERRGQNFESLSGARFSYCPKESLLKNFLLFYFEKILFLHEPNLTMLRLFQPFDGVACKRKMILSLQNFGLPPSFSLPLQVLRYIDVIYTISSAALCPTYHPQPIILIGSHRSPSSFLATDSVPPAPPFFYTESFLPLISSIINFFNL